MQFNFDKCSTHIVLRERARKRVRAGDGWRHAALLDLRAYSGGARPPARQPEWLHDSLRERVPAATTANHFAPRPASCRAVANFSPHFQSKNKRTSLPRRSANALPKFIFGCSPRKRMHFAVAAGNLFPAHTRRQNLFIFAQLSKRSAFCLEEQSDKCWIRSRSWIWMRRAIVTCAWALRLECSSWEHGGAPSDGCTSMWIGWGLWTHFTRS